MLKRKLLFCIVLFFFSKHALYGSDSSKHEDRIAQDEIGQDNGYFAQLNRLENQSPLLFNALAKLCEGLGSLGSLTLVIMGIHTLITKRDPMALVIFPLAPLPHYFMKYCCGKPIRLVGGLCVQTKNWTFESLKKVYNEQVPQ